MSGLSRACSVSPDSSNDWRRSIATLWSLEMGSGRVWVEFCLYLQSPLLSFPAVLLLTRLSGPSSSGAWSNSPAASGTPLLPERYTILPSLSFPPS